MIICFAEEKKLENFSFMIECKITHDTMMEFLVDGVFASIFCSGFSRYTTNAVFHLFHFYN